MTRRSAPSSGCRGITKTYGQGEAAFQALHGVDLAIDAGEFVAIMGPSGSGKSTAMNILGCLDTPTSGSYLFEGVQVEQLDAQPARAAAAPLPRLRVPGLQPAGAHHGAGERRAAADLPRRARRRAPRRGARGAGAGRPGRLGAPHAGRTLRRPAAARRHRPRDRHPARACCSPTSRPATSTPSTSREIMELLSGLNRDRGITILMVTHEPDMAGLRPARRPLRRRPGRERHAATGSAA